MTFEEIVGSIPITRVWQALGGGEVRHGRARAFWRDGDGFNVSLDDDKGTWYDHARCDGGGVLHLIQHVHGGDRKTALQWLADYAGRPLDSGGWTPRQRREYGRRRRVAEAEARELVQWRNELIEALRARRNLYQSAYHRTLRRILECGLHDEAGPAQASACECFERTYLDLDKQLDEFLGIAWDRLAAEWRARRRAA